MLWATKRGGFMSIKHKYLTDWTENLLNVCDNAETEPRLLRVTGENLENKMTNRCNEARVDKIKRVLAGKKPTDIFWHKGIRS